MHSMSEDDDIQIVEARPRLKANANNKDDILLEAIIAALKKSLLLRLSLYNLLVSNKVDYRTNCKVFNELLKIDLETNTSETEKFIRNMLSIRQPSRFLFCMISNLRKVLFAVKKHCFDFEETPLYRKFIPVLKPGAVKSFGKCSKVKDF